MIWLQIGYAIAVALGIFAAWRDYVTRRKKRRKTKGDYPATTIPSQSSDHQYAGQGDDL